MYSTRANLILGFHGCERSERDKLISDPSYIRSSHESYDWLGHGMYFWENNPSRALQWAQLKKDAGKLKEPSSVGAVLELGRCLDLLDSTNIGLLRYCFNLFKSESEALNKKIPANVDHQFHFCLAPFIFYLDFLAFTFVLHLLSFIFKKLHAQRSTLNAQR